MKLANGLSLLRIVLTPVLLVLLLWRPPDYYLLAAIVFLVAVASDMLDGYFARRRAAVSKLGVFLDLVADKVLTSSVLVAFVDLEIVPGWPVIVILCREFLITGFRTFAAAEGVVVPAAAWGKQKTAITNLAIFVLILQADFARGGYISRFGGLGPSLGVAPWLLYLAVVLTVTSGLLYLYSGRALFQRLVG
ncbi:MAG: CDP-diacylglycerol--glycerol-3-phosphate 3-phosphatidyltransferase [Chloroflexota bacterium]|nr:CDP-diacylglycerol--glycerol-3-phosphate 3-phosphatidyltransferase [Chloroflexota bacterium]